MEDEVQNDANDQVADIAFDPTKKKKKKKVVLQDRTDEIVDKLAEKTESLSVSDGLETTTFSGLKKKKKKQVEVSNAYGICKHNLIQGLMVGESKNGILGGFERSQVKRGILVSWDVKSTRRAIWPFELNRKNGWKNGEKQSRHCLLIVLNQASTISTRFCASSISPIAE
ncbi:hypothetical protein Csa_014332 [Cucumis sativus]|nr:hypothetical protein Csa_014332 [Cucumis sativus]